MAPSARHGGWEEGREQDEEGRTPIHMPWRVGGRPRAGRGGADPHPHAMAGGRKAESRTRRGGPGSAVSGTREGRSGGAALGSEVGAYCALGFLKRFKNLDWKGRCIERRRDGEEDLQSDVLLLKRPQQTGAEPIRSQEPRASLGSPTRVQGPKALGRPPLLSQATSRELDGKHGRRDRTGTDMGSW